MTSDTYQGLVSAVCTLERQRDAAAATVVGLIHLGRDEEAGWECRLRLVSLAKAVRALNDVLSTPGSEV